MMTDRWVAGRALRAVASDRAYSGSLPTQVNNGEENSFPFVANFSKGLPHEADGQVVPSAYRLLLRAVSTGRPEDFERIPLGTVKGRKLVNPQAGLAFDVEGPDAQGLTIAPAPRIDRPQNSAEMAELYWMALARDVNFTDFAADPVVAAAAADLTSNFTDFRGPKDGGAVTPATLFRGDTPGDLVGPYVSQFLFGAIPYGTLLVQQLQRTVPPGVDFLTTFPDWLAAQNGADIPPNAPSPTDLRYIQTPRDLATYVHFDTVYEACLNACLILLAMEAPFDVGNPYNFSQNQIGFATYGALHVLTLVVEVATRALKAAWYQKWFVHRRLRPEEFGGRIEAQRLGLATFPMIDPEILNSPVLAEVMTKFGSQLLPQAFAEGSPIHPSYAAGHATVSGACATILKAFFDESFILPGPVQVPDAAGTALVEDPTSPPLTVGGELNKLAANISIGRNMGGVHWRTDYSESVTLGEQVAIGILRDQKPTTNEDASFTLTRFDGTTITI